MRTLCIASVRPYEVKIGANILSRMGPFIQEIGDYQKAAVVTDDVVGALYGEKLKESLNEVGIQSCFFTFPHGEQSKNISVLQEIYSFLIQEEISRSDLIVAFGGGVAGDLTGFAAATYLRGVDYVQIPTTLVSQTDSSVGGKTAVNLKQGKNLMGFFYPPRLVLSDVSLIQEPFLLREGAAEVIKYGLLADRELFELLEQGLLKTRLEDVVARSVEIKGSLVEGDEWDRGRRQLLNLGHTLGHGIEKVSGYTVPHGIAVGIGMAAMLSACAANGLLDYLIYNRLLAILKQYGLPSVYREASLEMLIQAAFSDKKRSGNDINIVVCKDIGNCQLMKIRLDQLYGFLRRGWNGH